MIKLFDDNYSSEFFDNNDYFGVTTFRSDVTNVISSNNVRVLHRKRYTQFDDNLDGNFGSDFTLPSNDVFEEEYVWINVISRAPNNHPLQKQGYDGKGSITYDCITSYDVVFGNEDELVFLENNDIGITKGQVFKIIPGDKGVVKGLFTHQSFTIVLISDVKNEVSED